MINKGLIFQEPQQQQQQHVVVVEENISNLTSASGEAASVSSDNRGGVYPQRYLSPQTTQAQTQTQAQSQPVRKKRNLPGNPDPDAEVIALSPKSLMATNRFVCDICNKGFQRDQNLQLHRRGHNLPWKLKQRTNKEIRKKVYICPETSCVHHDPSKALGDLTGIKKHFCRKHGEKKWKCDKCSKLYAVRSDLKAHSKTCGTREYRCDCGTLFSRRDSYVTHRSLCDALAEESARVMRTGNTNNPIFSFQPGGSSSTSHQMNLQITTQQQQQQKPRFDDQNSSHGIMQQQQQQPFSLKKEPQTFDLQVPQWLAFQPIISRTDHHLNSSSIFNNQELSDERIIITNPNNLGQFLPPFHHHHHHYQTPINPHISATALLQKATQMGATMSNSSKTSSSPAMFHHHHHHQGQGGGPHQAHVSEESSNNNNNNNSTFFGLNMSSREELSNGFVYNFGNKSACDHAGATGTAAGTSSGGLAPSSSTLLQDMMMTSLSSSSGFEGSTFEDAFGGFLNNPKRDVHDETRRFSGAEDGGGHRGGGGGGGSDGMTRDFLGLKPLSHGEFFNIAGIGNCMNTGNDEQQNQNQKPWQE